MAASCNSSLVVSDDVVVFGTHSFSAFSGTIVAGVPTCVGLSLCSSTSGMKLRSKTFSLVSWAGPVNGPWPISSPAPTKPSGEPIMFAFCSNSMILSNSSSPASRAWALAIRGDVWANRSLSRMNSMLRLSTFCRLCSESPLWQAKEKECRDSEGKRVRSSPKGSKTGMGKSEKDVCRVGGTDEEGDSGGNLGEVDNEGLRGGCRIRRRPVSRSAVNMGDLRAPGDQQVHVLDLSRPYPCSLLRMLCRRSRITITSIDRRARLSAHMSVHTHKNRPIGKEKEQHAPSQVVKCLLATTCVTRKPSPTGSSTKCIQAAATRAL